MRKRLLIVLLVLSGIFLIYTSIVYACLGNTSSLKLEFDPADENNWSMRIKISGSTESILNILLKDYTKQENNSKGVRQVLGVSMIDPALNTFCTMYNDDSKDPVIFTFYSEFRRIKRYTKTEFENNKYENTALTLKEIMDTTVKLIDRDQIMVNDHTVTVMERNIDIKISYNRL
jgi:hypothetical protein